MGGGGGSSEPTLQQKQLEAQQARTTADLNLEENAQRKAILSSAFGTRLFRGSALSRMTAGNTPGAGNDVPPGAPSGTQTRSGGITGSPPSLLDLPGAGSTPAGGTGGSGGGGHASGGRPGGAPRAGRL